MIGPLKTPACSSKWLICTKVHRRVRCQLQRASVPNQMSVCQGANIFIAPCHAVDAAAHGCHDHDAPRDVGTAATSMPPIAIGALLALLLFRHRLFAGDTQLVYTLRNAARQLSLCNYPFLISSLACMPGVCKGRVLGSAGYRVVSHCMYHNHVGPSATGHC